MLLQVQTEETKCGVNPVKALTMQQRNSERIKLVYSQAVLYV